jgi:hypothetical protein
MNRIRGGATAVGMTLFVMLLAVGSVARAQETTGRVVGRVTDKDSGTPLGGVTVIVQGPQGEDATITDDKGDYLLTALPIGTYTIRFYAANTSSQVEQTGVVVAAQKTVRVNAKIALAATAAAAPQQTYVITGRVPMIDVGSARVGYTFNEDFTLKVPNGIDYGSVIQKAPGVFVDGTGNISIGGATGLENIYIVNGMNVTGMDMGNLESGASTLGGGTNLPSQFLTQIDVNSGGYQAEYGGAMGGVINSVLKSGSNEFHGSVLGYWSPYWLSASPNAVALVGSALGSVRKPDFDTSIGVEVGGPIIKDKLFFWAGFVPRFQNSHVFRLTYAQTEDANNPGQALLDANGNPRLHELTDWRARINESRQVYSYAATLDWTPLPENRLTLGVFGTPNFNNQMRSVFGPGLDAISNPAWAQENLSKTNTDVTARWVSKLYDRRWIIEANAGLHREDFNDRSPDGALNNLNQLEYWNTNLWDLEHAPGCEPTASGFQPCPIGAGSNPYHTGGFGLTKQFTGQRWMGEIKSTNLFQAGGHHELKYGWRIEYSTFDQDRYYSGPLGSRSLVILNPNDPTPNFNTWSFFTLQPGQYPSDFGPGGRPFTDLLQPPIYQDHLKADVTSLLNSFFVQDSYSPSVLRNLTINAGARLELQKMTDTFGKAFLSLDNLAPRVGVIYDPFGDGLSKISASYGQYYEQIPMNLAARYFGGEGILVRNGVPISTCPANLQSPTPYVNGQANPNAWTGNGEWGQCSRPAISSTNDPAAGGTSPFNNGSDYPVQANLRGQYNNEITATIERELMENLTLRLDYVHRWLGRIIEDGTADPTGSFAFVLANPGDVPPSALNQAKDDVTAAQTAVNNITPDPNNPATVSALANAQSQLAAAQAKYANLQGLAAAPKPERTYDGITLSLAKRFSKNWFTRASYTYSRLVGNYEGLFQAESSYFAPNGSNAYDTPDLYLNQRGYLPNDHPHQGRVDGYYTHDIGRGTFTFGLSFMAQSGMPRNYLSAWYFNSPQNQLLPRGSGGRTPPVSELDAKFMYGRPIPKNMRLEAFIDLFNILNQQATLITDDVYTFDPAAAIVGGTPSDLKYAKNLFGAPVTKNPDYGHALAYQTPFHARLGLRLTF